MNDIIRVFHNKIEVGKLGYQNNKIIFQYNSQWVKKGFSIFPKVLPLNNDVFIFNDAYELEGLYGPFYDSLPDQWGYILVKRFLKTKGIDYDSLGVLEKLLYVSKYSIGSLNYKPSKKFEKLIHKINLDTIYEQTTRILNDEEIEDYDELFSLGGSSGGSRPKINLKIGDKLYIVKFPSSQDSKNMGQMEFDYMNVAKQCKINIPNILLFPSNKYNGFFGIERFDYKKDGSKYFVITASSLYNKDPFNTVFSYKHLFMLTSYLTNHNLEDIEQLYRIMVFNCLANNQDDHAKNISFIYDDDKSIWRLAPAYDLTLSHTPFNQHQILVNNKGNNFSKDDLIYEAKDFGISNEKLSAIYDEMNQIISNSLSNYLKIK